MQRRGYRNEKLDSENQIIPAGGKWERTYTIGSDSQRWIKKISFKAPKGCKLLLNDGENDINPDATERGAFPIDLKENKYNLGAGAILKVKITNTKQKPVTARSIIDVITGPKVKGN